jgi:IclR family acetate operon transcriptional repressor
MVDRQAYIVKPISKALRLLQILANTGRRQSLREVCVLSGLPKSTAFKYLRTLLDADYIDHDPATDTYGVSLMVWELGCRVNEGAAIRSAALPAMLELASRLNRSVSLGILNNGSVLCLEVVESRPGSRLNVRTGDRHKVGTSAPGRAILAGLPGQDWQRHVAAELDLAGQDRGDRVTTMRQIERHIALVRSRGFAIDRGETFENSWCIAAPVRDRSRTAGAISLGADLNQLGSELERRRTVKAVIDSAMAVSAWLSSEPLAAASLDEVPVVEA